MIHPGFAVFEAVSFTDYLCGVENNIQKSGVDMKTTNQDSSETGFMRRVRALVGRRQAAEPAAVVR